MPIFTSIIFHFFINNAYSQIADASFFSSMKSINPGIAHLRQNGLIGFDYKKNNINKVHDFPLYGIVGGVVTDVKLTKNSFFLASKGKGNFLAVEILADKESGTKNETINSSLYGNRTVTNEVSSDYLGAILDLQFFGISYSTVNYKYDYKFRVGTPPDVSAKDINSKQKYNLLKGGFAYNFRGITLGGYYLSQSSKGDISYTYYDPTTGNKGSIESSPLTTGAKGFGIGSGYTNSNLHIELSLEKMNGQKVEVQSNYPEEMTTPPDASRISLVAEAKIAKFSIGTRISKNVGNFTDLENIISSQLLYGEMTATDSRIETIYNFSMGSQVGFGASVFYATSNLESQEESSVFKNGEKYKAVTASKAYGFSLSYGF